ncbi:membrane dipeptidase [Sphingomonas sp. CFBP 13720]|uniref:membrane dipeptidase n=1 Tax=Sphingomonas sp. CFBP 13720 TaxID=2775302 RepID=UPI001783355E|nr:membrane dipeptidase [Sphingomonas sp. CFBP 13720]MBD8679915.1 membrane dipeptidase [Sphingomonas sp. CFBP 13720]
MDRYWTRRAALAGMMSLTTAAVARPVRTTAAPFIDSLSFLPDDLADIARAGLGAMIADISEVEEVRDAAGVPRYLRGYRVSEAALTRAVARLAASPHAYVALKGSDIGSRPGCATFLQFQSTEMIERDLSRIARFHAGGLRVLQFTHHNDNPFAGGALQPVQTGLTPLGIDGLAEMNRLRILPDVSHGSDATMREAARRSTTPIALSHGAARAIVNHPRCAPDDVIRAIAERGGVMGVFMMSFWLTRKRVPTVADYVANIRHVVRVGGIDAVGVANDFPMAGQANLVKLDNDNAKGVGEYLAWWRAMRSQGIAGFDWTPEHVVIPALNRIDRMQRIADALRADRFRAREVDAIMGGNWRRLLTNVLG